MLTINEIKNVHLELSSFCNAECPLCPRNFRGYPYNDGYPETNLSLEQIKHIFHKQFLKQLDGIYINGNYGDFVMNPESVDIIRYFKTNNKDLRITVSTNGGARDREFWQDLGSMGITVNFCLDGLGDTHHLYRKNTVWETVIKNAITFIDSGGEAIWKMIKFDHNSHQIEDCRTLSKKLQFKNFKLVETKRNSGPVFNKSGELLHTIGNYSGETNFQILFYKKKTDMVLLEDILPGRIPKKEISCQTQTLKEIYIASNGELYPCCFTGFYPRTYGRGEYHEAVNSQLSKLMSKNNLLENSLEECISWFNNISQCWNIPSYETGRLIVCDDNCGS